MSDYRRFISYIYLYENNIKSMNAGFVKVESRNGQCRLSLSLRNVYSVASGCQVYVFMRVGQELRGIYIGEIRMQNHGCDWNFRTETENIAGSGYGLDQMAGMVIQAEENKFYGTRWDQGDLDIHRFVTQWEPDIRENDMPENVESPVSDETYKDETYKEIISIEQHCENEEIVKDMAETPCSENLRYQNFEKILEQCPGMYPFEDDAIRVCARLEPQDIGMMPLDCWAYGSNSFLLHSYYSYRHLILARMKSEDNTSDVYILGVPGTKHSRDAFMANMFGFRMFKPIREDAESPGNFGYWYTIL